MAIYLVRSFSSDIFFQEVKTGPDQGNTGANKTHDSACVKLITKFYSCGFLNNLLLRG